MHNALLQWSKRRVQKGREKLGESLSSDQFYTGVSSISSIIIDIHDFEEKEALFNSKLADVRQAAILRPEGIALAPIL